MKQGSDDGFRPAARGRWVAWCAVVALLGGLTLGGCPGPDNPYLPYPEPNFDQFEPIVQPILGGACSNLGCHGDANRRLTLYSLEYLRAEPAVPGTPLDNDELSGAELAWNYDMLRARLIDVESADDATLLLKCLDPEAGGIVHADGEVVFWSTDEPDYVALRDWIETGL